jgi:hypothetical protein
MRCAASRSCSRNARSAGAPAPTPEWGLHLLDATLSQGNLINIVAAESKAYLGRGGA